MENRVIFSLRSNRRLAKRIAKHYHAQLGEISIDRFKDGEILVKTLTNCSGKDVVIVESTAIKAHERLFELLLLVDSIKRTCSKSIKLYIPYFGYSRQERVSWINEPISCEVVAKILDTAKVDEILTFDLHHPDIEKFFETKFTSIPTTSLFTEYYKNYLSNEKINFNDVIIVSPDHGANARADALVKELPGTRKVILNKYRTAPNYAEHLAFEDDVKNKVCIIIDDIIDTGGTIISASNLLLEHGARSVLVGASHAVLSNKSVDKLLDSHIKDLVFTNTIEKRLPKRIKVLDISKIIKL